MGTHTFTFRTSLFIVDSTKRSSGHGRRRMVLDWRLFYEIHLLYGLVMDLIRCSFCLCRRQAHHSNIVDPWWSWALTIRGVMCSVSMLIVLVRSDVVTTVVGLSKDATDGKRQGRCRSAIILRGRQRSVDNIFTSAMELGRRKCFLPVTSFLSLCVAVYSLIHKTTRGLSINR